MNADLAKQLVTVEGTGSLLFPTFPMNWRAKQPDPEKQHNLQSQFSLVAPSAIVAAIQSTGRDAILRGSGKPNSMPFSITHHTARLICECNCG